MPRSGAKAKISPMQLAMIDYSPYLAAILGVLIYFLLGQIKQRRRKAAEMRKLAERELDVPQLAQNLLAFAAASIQRGEHQEALAMIEMAVEIYRQQLAEGVAELRHELAGSLSTMAACLFYLERYQEALASVDEAIAITTALTEHDHEAFQIQLDKSLELKRYILANKNEVDENRHDD